MTLNLNNPNDTRSKPNALISARRARGLLDAALIAVEVGAVGWQLLIGPQLGGRLTLVAATSIAYPLRGVVIVACLAAVGIGGRRGLSVPVRLTGLAFAVVVGAGIRTRPTIMPYRARLSNTMTGSLPDPMDPVRWSRKARRRASDRPSHPIRGLRGVGCRGSVSQPGGGGGGGWSDAGMAAGAGPGGCGVAAGAGVVHKNGWLGATL